MCIRDRGCEAIIRTAVSEIKKKIPDAVIDLASYRIESDGCLLYTSRCV